MIDGKKILAIIPARGNSEGIRLKNLSKICKKTLIEIVSDVILKLKIVDRSIVSTDHPLIADEAKRNGLDVPFIRPERLSGGFVSDLDVLTHAITEAGRIYKEKYDIVVMLQPTCPLRKAEHVLSTVEKLINSKYDSVWTISRVNLKFHPLKQLVFSDDKLCYSNKNGAGIIARQQLDSTYMRNGACYAFTHQCIVEKHSILTDNSSYVLISDFLVNIDTPEDLTLARKNYAP